MVVTVLLLLLIALASAQAKDWFWSQSESDRSALEISYKGEAPLAWVGTLSGEIHALDTKTGNVLWSADLGGSTIRSFQALDAVDEGVVVPGADGSIFVHSKGELKRFPLSIADFVEKSPMFQVLPNGRRLTIVGSKSDRVFQLNASTGKILRSFSSEAGDEAAYRADDGEFEGQSSANILFVNRHDYRVRAFEEESGKEVWNFTYGVLDPVSGKADDGPRTDGYLIGSAAEGLFDRIDTVWNHSSPVTTAAITLDDDAVVVAKRSVISSLALNGGAVGSSAAVKRMMLKDGSLQLYVGPSDKSRLGQPNEASSSDSKAIALVSDEFSSADPGVNHMDGTCDIVGDHMVVPYLPEALGLYSNVTIKPKQDISSTDIDRNTIFAIVGLIFTCFGIVSWVIRKMLAAPRAMGKVSENDLVLVSSESPKSESPILAKPIDEIPLRLDEGTHRVGKLTVFMSKIKGYGGNGTIVLEGRFEERPVAVKRMQSALYDRASKEIDFLIQSEGHSNVVRYLAKEETPDFVYLALELCEMTLDQAIESFAKTDVYRPPDSKAWISDATRQFLQELGSATNHLHINGIVHCDIKPQNVLVVPRPGRSGDFSGDFGAMWMPKLSDMGLSRSVDTDQSSFRFKSHTAGTENKSQAVGGGTVGWRAPELLVRSRDKKSRLSRKVDVFSLGCVFFYVLRGGSHPFGEWLQRESNIVEGSAVGLDKSPASFAEARNLIAVMVAHEPGARLSMAACLAHPLLWPAKARLDFLCDVSNRLEKVDPNSTMLKDLESRAKRIFPLATGWANRLNATLESDVEASKHRKYDVDSLRDLLRYIRNKRHHFDEDPGLSRVLSWEPESFLQVFSGAFPDLIVQSYEWAIVHCGLEPKFIDILGGPDVVGERTNALPKVCQEDMTVSSSCKRRTAGSSRDWWPEDWVNDFPDQLPIMHPQSFNHKSMLCAHWERSGGQYCVMGSKCGFAHGPVELRILPEGSFKPNTAVKASPQMATLRSTEKRPPPRVINRGPPTVNMRPFTINGE